MRVGYGSSLQLPNCDGLCCRQLAIKALNERLNKSVEEGAWPGLDDEEEVELETPEASASSHTPTAAADIKKDSPRNQDPESAWRDGKLALSIPNP